MPELAETKEVKKNVAKATWIFMMGKGQSLDRRKN
jgi:hypothetical protein